MFAAAKSAAGTRRTASTARPRAPALYRGEDLGVFMVLGIVILGIAAALLIGLFQ
jgi:hypothetical protein